MAADVLSALRRDPELAATLRVASMVGEQVLVRAAMQAGASEDDAARAAGTLPVPSVADLSAEDLAAMAGVLDRALQDAQAENIGLADTVRWAMRIDNNAVRPTGFGLEAGALVLAACLGVAVVLLVAKLNGSYDSTTGALRVALEQGVPERFAPVVEGIAKIIGAAPKPTGHDTARNGDAG